MDASALKTVEEVAAILRCKRTKVFALLADGTLERGPKFGKATVVTAESVTRALEMGPTTPAPKKVRRRFTPKKAFAEQVAAVVAKARGKTA